MGSLPRNSRVLLRRKPVKSRRSLRRAQQQRRHNGNGGSKRCLSDKLEALRNLIPIAKGGGEVVKADRLFEETADYILKLRNQVFVLQRLVGLYGSSISTAQGGGDIDSSDNGNDMACCDATL